MQKKAIVLGATGLVGQQLVQQLLADEQYAEVRIAVRREWPGAHPKLKVQQVDFHQLADYASFFQVDDIFCGLGTTMATAGSKAAFYRVDYTYVVEAARLGLAQGARQFLVISSVGADAGSPFFYNKTKGEMEAAVQALGFPQLKIFHPSFLDGDRKEDRMGERIGIAVFNFISQLGLLKSYQPVTDKTVARAMRLAARENKSGNTTYNNLEIVALGRKK